jgi:uncharacterized protein
MIVEHDTAQHRFVVRLPEGTGELVYRSLGPDTLDLVHTGVESSLKGRGVGDALVRAALAHARENWMHIVATCPYVRHWLSSHPEERDLLSPGAAAQ